MDAATIPVDTTVEVMEKDQDATRTATGDELISIMVNSIPVITISSCNGHSPTNETNLLHRLAAHITTPFPGGYTRNTFKILGHIAPVEPDFFRNALEGHIGDLEQLFYLLYSYIGKVFIYAFTGYLSEIDL